ncbi:ubiquitin-conjugating enzyme E2 T [Trichonephila clavipes]|nr:ubiquitin-conjugating enzyme E2 T [Trichonephila clavipes]
MQSALRLKKELERFSNEPNNGISCWQDEDLQHLKATIVGPDSSPYENGVFHIDIQIPEKYPFLPPNVHFITPVYHPNIDDSGRICLEILKLPPQGAWKPSLNLKIILMSIQGLLAEPNFNDPLMTEISQEYEMNRSSFVIKAREWTKKYALMPNTFDQNGAGSSKKHCEETPDLPFPKKKKL